jgi:hypothetical protein
MLALWLALQAGPARPPEPAPWRVYTSEGVHVGVRPAMLLTPGERAVGLTVQVRLSIGG